MSQAEQKPSVGRIVHVVAGRTVLPAIVVRVDADPATERVNLCIFNDEPGEDSTTLRFDVAHDESGVGECTWHWPPRVA